MSNLSDKEIDRLSREAADSYEPDHSSLSWSRLEQMLTKQMPERPPDGFRFGRISPYIWGPAVLLFAGISFYLIKNKIYSQHSTQTSQSVTTPASPSSADNSKAKGNTSYTDSSSAASSSVKSQNGDVTDNKKSLPADAIDQRALVNTTSGNKTETGNKSGTGKPTGVFIGSNSAAHIKSGKKDAGSNTILSGSLATAGEMDDKSSLAPASTLESRSAGIFSTLPPLALSGSKLGKVKGNDSLLNRPASAQTPVPHKSLRINRSLNFGFAFGPDYSDAGGISNNQFGNNVGLTVGYYLTNKLSINAGIFYSNKFFWSPGFGPGRPQQTSTGTGYAVTTYAAPTIENVNGSFNMYELPLTLRYDFAHSGKSKFFANAGLSSYFIINQSYIYFYHSGFRPSAWKVTDNSQENYWFGTVNLSLGVETEIGKGFSFQVEPFLKIPHKQMGLENVKLNSYGFLLSFRYTPVLSRSKK